MAYQPLYGRISDSAGGYAHSLVLRGRVDNVHFWLNSWFGEVVNLNARFIDGRQIIKRPDLRKIRKTEREEALKQYEEEVDNENRVIVDIDIPAKRELIFRINGIELSYDRLKLMEDMKLNRMDKTIEALKQLKENDSNVLKIARVMLQ